MKQNKIRPFGMRDKLGYLFGDFGNDFTFILSTSILMKFYTDVMGVSAGIVGIIMMIARFADAVTDVTMGRICDAAKPTAAGKFKPWLLRMCIPVAAASFLMYAPGLSPETVSRWSDGTRIAFLAITYILWGSFCYTGVNIPYGSMASAISADPGDRASLSTFRTMGGMLAGMFIGIGLPLVAYDKITSTSGETLSVINGSKVAISAAVFSVLAILCYLLSYQLITERVPYKAEKRQKTGVTKMIRSAITNRSLISIIFASVFMLLAQLTMQNMSAYIFPDYYGNAAGQTLSSLTMMGSMLIASVAAKPLSNRFGKAEVSAASSLFAVIVCVITWLIRPKSMWGFIALQSLIWLGLGVFSMICWALITDVIDDAELKNGIREDGSVYALYSFARKLGQAFAAGLSGWLLEAIRYNEKALEQGISQTQAVKDGIFNISTLVPALGFAALAVVLWFWYPLHKKRVESNAAAIKRKHDAEKDR
ncbi:MAG: MFS transporter [Oscillospiraceae bacterium]|nr:MFS transporter [Oscillospiraceae bacterium]